MKLWDEEWKMRVRKKSWNERRQKKWKIEKYKEEKNEKWKIKVESEERREDERVWNKKCVYEKVTNKKKERMKKRNTEIESN